MKKRWTAAILSALFLIAGIVFFAVYHNLTNPQKPLASVDGGYYKDAFSLKLSTWFCNTIYYTTDGSAPTLDSQVYQGGIWIEDRSSQENVYQNIQNVVKNWQAFQPDTTPVPKGTVIRAISVSPLGNISDVFTQTYFVGMEPPSNGYVLSLAFEPEDMFGDDGIYVTGKEYDDWYLNTDHTDGMPAANFEKRIEVPALLELMDANGDVINQQIGLRIQGASTRQDRSKRFILTAREEYSGSKVFDEKIFGVNTHSVMLKPLSVDSLVNDFVSDRAVATQKSERVDVYLNGEFWYTTYMLERYDNRYYEEYYGAEDVVEVEDGSDLEVGKDTIPTYLDFRKWVAESDCSTAEFWQQLQTRMDVQSYIDYVAINYYLGNIDVHEWQNYRMWRATDTDANEKYRDTRWKWCIYDVDAVGWSSSAFGVQDVAPINTFATIGSHPGQPLATTTLFEKLLENAEFRKQFALSTMDIVNNNFAVERAQEVLSSHGLGPDFMNSYFMKRPTYAPQHLAELLNLQGSVETVMVTTSNTAGGTVTVNTSQIDLSEGQWDGKYFTDYPITITATPNPGYRFVGWKGATNTADATITLPVDGGIALEAVFSR